MFIEAERIKGWEHLCPRSKRFGKKSCGGVGESSVQTQRNLQEIVPMASNTITIELSDQDRRRIDALCKAMCPTGTVAVVVYVETVGFTDGVHLFSSVDDAERWMLQEIRQHGGEQSHLTPDEFQKRLKPNEDFWIVKVHDHREEEE